MPRRSATMRAVVDANALDIAASKLRAMFGRTEPAAYQCGDEIGSRVERR